MPEMLSTAKLKYLKSLQHKKYRQKYSEFLIEGDKVVAEALHSDWEVTSLVYTAGHEPPALTHTKAPEVVLASAQQMQQLSSLHTPPGMLAVVKIQAPTALELTGWTLALDGIRDPGNMGTLIRTAAWMGFRQVICSEDTVDLYNPKTIQATMGALFHLPVRYGNLDTLLQEATPPIYAADMSGTTIEKIDIPEQGILVIGGESSGVREVVLQRATEVVSIPSSGKGESLNAAVAAGILMWEISRRTGAGGN